ncbi:MULTISPECIES: peptidoglycan-binding domain-containing protein [Roseomonadaceae]|uniref:Peptidoglycan-binding protein n=1 Tax=Falsiroseomonas oleicola TaxID=2801474 RepID=A0ABS6HF61_9PROT|nr:peptidoglycan-binding protein [Roseomonas oleicola]MBU8545920.1 peptidoglycan-binding protein [Roseomonas oleicola]
MNNKARLLGAAALGLMVAACGTDPQERVSGGAAAGAATGAGVGALGGPVGALAGAAIGGGAGAVTGATTSPSDVNLGRPVWNDPQTRVPGVTSPPRNAGPSTTRQAQRALTARGFNAGGADGIMGPRTSQAASDFQRANNLEVTGRLDSATLSALNVGAGRTGMRGASRANPNAAYQGGGMVQPVNQAQMGANPDRSGVATDADPGTGGTGGSGGSNRGANSPNYGGSGTTNPMERSGTATGADPGSGGTGGSGGGAMTRPTGPGVTGQTGGSGSTLERSGVATDADPGTGGTGGSGGSSGGTTMPPR